MLYGPMTKSFESFTMTEAVMIREVTRTSIVETQEAPFTRETSTQGMKLQRT